MTRPGGKVYLDRRVGTPKVIRMRISSMKFLYFTIVVLLVCIPVFAIAEEPPPAVVTNTEAPVISGGASLYQSASPFSLFDPSRLTFNQSYSLSYFSGRGTGSQSLGLYSSSIGYQISKPLFLQVDVGILHQPGALLGNSRDGSNAQVLPNLSLRYTPSPKFNLILNVQTMPGLNYGYGPTYGRYGFR